tara:strand:- start:1236 stop:1433 length:198 start_codon:yes stop_codon:yes gene_type:complete
MNSQRLTQILLTGLIATQISGLIDRFKVNYSSESQACEAWEKEGGKVKVRNNKPSNDYRVQPWMS